MIPDSFTFGSLFNAIERLGFPRDPIRPARQPVNAPTPRKLFREMLECHVLAAQEAQKRRRPIVRVSTLNVALRVFMLSMDYPAAFVTLQTFRRLGLQPDARSYRFVLIILLRHARAGLEPGRSRRPQLGWAVNFLCGGEGRGSVEAKDIQLETAHALLHFAKDTTYRTPELAVILGDEKAPEDAEWDIEPLERLVARAILADMAPEVLSEWHVERALRGKLAPYFYEMVPDRLWQGRRLRRATW